MLPFVNANVSFVQFSYENTGEDITKNLRDKLIKFGCRDIDDQQSEEVSYGWCSFEDLTDTEFRKTPVMYGNYAMFALRLDERKVPVNVLKKHVSIALEKERQTLLAQGKKYVTGGRKKEITEQIQLKLKMRYLPSPSHYPIIVDPSKHHILLFTTMQKITDLFESYFAQTFGLHIVRQIPYNMVDTSFSEFLPAVNVLTPSEFWGPAFELEGVASFIQREFMLWLYWFSCDHPFRDHNGEMVDITVSGPITIYGQFDLKKESTTITGDNPNLTEAFVGLKLGKYPVSYQVSVMRDDLTWKFTLKENMAVSGLKTPKIGDFEGDEEGALLEKVYFINEVVEFLHSLFHVFLEWRTSAAQWEAYRGEVMSWVEENIANNG